MYFVTMQSKGALFLHNKHGCLSLPMLGAIKNTTSVCVQTSLALLHKILLSRNSHERLTDLSPVLCHALSRCELPLLDDKPLECQGSFLF